MYTAVPNKAVPAPDYSLTCSMENAIDPTQSRKILEWVPVKDTRAVTLIWPMPSLEPHYLAKPCSYLTHLLGHEGEGLQPPLRPSHPIIKRGFLATREF